MMTKPDALAERAVDPWTIVLGLEAAHLGAQLEDAQRRRVVDPDGKSIEKRCRLGEVVPIAVLQEPLAHLADVDAPLAAHHTARELLARHFEREHAPPRSPALRATRRP